VIITWFFQLLDTILHPLLSLLPTGQMTFPGLGAITDFIGNIESVVPVAGPIELAMMVLPAVLIFISIRVLVFIWKLLPFT
jgi:hypothetical protein